MPWAAFEPQSLDEKVDLLRQFRGQFDLGDNYIYAIFAADESEVIGGSGLHPRVGEEAFEIGYWIRADATRRGFVTESTAALTRAAFELCGVDRVEIHVEPENEISLRVPRKLGYVEEATLRRRLPPHEPDGPRRDAVVFTMLAEHLADSPCANASFKAYDAAGRSVDERP
jgi:RimJ/RimL family protein N-acetyltransferase